MVEAPTYITTQIMIYSVTNYLELCNAIIVYCAFFFINHGRIGCLDTIEH